MKVLLDFPSIIKTYAPYFEDCFSEAGFTHFKKALSGFLVSENKTLEGINRLFVEDSRHQSSFNRFFNRQNFDLTKLNRCRLKLLQAHEGTRFKAPGKPAGGVLAIDNTLLSHYGKCFDQIYNLYNSTDKNYCWAHDLVTLHYSDGQTDYPVYYQLWEPPDWEAVARFFMDVDYHINEQKWQQRQEEPQKWKNYIRNRYRLGRKKHPEVLQVHKTKIHIAEELLRQFCTTYPHLNYPVLLDSGFTSSEFCHTISETLQRDYVGNLRGDQTLIRAGNQPILLRDFVEELKVEHAEAQQKGEAIFQKVGYTYQDKKTYYYAYVANHRIKHFKKKQRLVIAFDNKELTGTPYFVITNRLNWYPSGILRLRRQRWPIETYHQEAKAEGLDKYQVRNEPAISTHIALVVVTYSMLQCAIHDDDLLSSIRQRLQMETDGTLPFLRRLMQAESLVVLVEYVFLQLHKGHSLNQVLEAFCRSIAYS